MTVDDWCRQMALAGVLEPETQVVMRDAMDFPVVALWSGLRTRSAEPEIRLEPAGSGVIVRHRPPRDPARPSRRLALAGSLARAAEMGRRAWGSRGYLISDGDGLAAVGSRVPAAQQAALRQVTASRGRRDPARVVRSLSPCGEAQLLETGEIALWVDPLRCLRRLDLAAARALAVRGEIRPDGQEGVTVRLPAGRTRLVFSGVRAAPVLTPPPGGRVAAVDEATWQVDFRDPVQRSFLLAVRAFGARLDRIGLVVSTDERQVDEPVHDPLSVYADPFHMDDAP